MRYKAELKHLDGSISTFGPTNGYASVENAKKGAARFAGITEDEIELINLVGARYTSVGIPEVGVFFFEEVVDVTD